MPALRTSWMDRWKRLTSMDRAEFVDRVRQQIMVRADVLRYRAGFQFGDQTTTTGTHSDGKFFFSPGAVPLLCGLLKKRLPVESEAILQRAQCLCEHRFD